MMSNPDGAPAWVARLALIQVLMLTMAALAAFLPEVRSMASLTVTDLESAHALAAPLLILLVFLHRRRLLAESVDRGHWAGLTLVVVGLIILAAASWPFNYGYPRWLALVPVIAGTIVVAAGWRGLRASLPLLLLLLIAIPVGSRFYAFLIIRTETLTMATAAMVLDALPGVMIALDGQDFSYTRGATSGTFALGEPHRGATIFMAYLIVGVYLTFMRVRPLWQIIALAIVSGPILLLCNLTRLVAWGTFAIYRESHPLSQTPRIIATVTALLLAYVLFAGCAWILRNMISDNDAAETAPAAG